MGIVVKAPEVQVRVRQYKGSAVWTIGLRELSWIPVVVLILFMPQFVGGHMERMIYFMIALFVLQMAAFSWRLVPKWVATLRPSGIEYRSQLAASFGMGEWKKAPWDSVDSLKSTKTYERNGVVATWGVQMDIRDPDEPTGFYSLRISAMEMAFLEYLEAMVRWTDPAKVDPDLMRVLGSDNRKKLESSRKFGWIWGMVMGLVFGIAIFGAKGYPASERWIVYGAVWILAMLLGYVVRYIRKS